MELRKLSLRKTAVKLPKLGWVKFRASRSLEGETIRSATLTKEGAHWFVSLLVEDGVSTPAGHAAADTAVGVDRGVVVAVATSAGVGFIFELMIYWQEWLEERGIEADEAQEMTIQTFAGAAELAFRSRPQSLSELQAKVTSKKGITAAGLESMRELEIERLLRYSFEKAALRDRELSQD